MICPNGFDGNRELPVPRLPVGLQTNPRLLPHGEMSPPVLLPARIVVLHAEGTLLAIADRLDPVGGYAQRDHEILGRLRTTVAQSNVVFGGSTLVAVTFEHNL